MRKSRNPGSQFLQVHGNVHEFNDVMKYIKFLRTEAEISDQDIPIQLTKIYDAFDLRKPVFEDLGDTRGFFQPELGIVMINSQDSAYRKRFTEAHELVERLFDQLNNKDVWNLRKYGNFQDSIKEGLCNRGAAELLIPRSDLNRELPSNEVSMKSARFISNRYEVSLTAALLYLVTHFRGMHALVFWEMRYKPTEQKILVPDNQLSYFGPDFHSGPQKKLRIRWAAGSPSAQFIPRNKSIPEDSSVFQALISGSPNNAMENIYLTRSLRGKARFENLPFRVGSDMKVISLIHLPGDNDVGHTT